MENFKELCFEDKVEISGGGKFWDWVKENYVYIIIGAAIGALVAE